MAGKIRSSNVPLGRIARSLIDALRVRLRRMGYAAGVYQERPRQDGETISRCLRGLNHIIRPSVAACVRSMPAASASDAGSFADFRGSACTVRDPEGRRPEDVPLRRRVVTRADETCVMGLGMLLSLKIAKCKMNCGNPAAVHFQNAGARRPRLEKSDYFLSAAVTSART